MSRLARRSPIGDKIAAEQDAVLTRRALDEGSAEAAKTRLRIALKERPAVRRRVPFSKRLVFAIAATFVIGLFFSVNAWRHRPQPLAFQIDGQPAIAGAWLRAPADHGADLRFSDASVISLEPSGRARVVDVDANGARVLLESGVAHVSITHRDASKWHVIAGPFDVVVTGTEFDVAWDPSREQFYVHMKHGTVHVLGALLGEGHSLTTGQSLEVSLPDGVVHETQGDARQGTVERQDIHETPENAADRGSDAGVVEQPHAAEHAQGIRQAAPPAWAILAANGEYARAVEDAESSGFDAACNSGKRSDVLALGDAARFSGHDDEARAAYAAVRSRGRGDDVAAEAAFDLGRLAFDREHQYALAATWFATYGGEEPNGPLAREAAGRLLEARQRSGDTQLAKDAARSYLARYPDGPRADLARSLIASGDHQAP